MLQERIGAESFSPAMAPLAESEILPERSDPLQEFGHIALGANIEMDLPRTPLPEGYEYADIDSILPAELPELMRQVEIGKNTSDDYLADRSEVAQEEGMSFLDVGVRSAEGQLVAFGTVMHKDGVGEMGDFVTRPSDQGKGIGKAVIDERLRLAEEAGLKTLYITRLEPTNTLKKYYLEKGFAETPSGGLMRGDHPAPPTSVTNKEISDATLSLMMERFNDSTPYV